jgi:hypothetical protein
VTHDPLALNFLGIDQTGFPDLKAKFQNMYWLIEGISYF